MRAQHTSPEPRDDRPLGTNLILTFALVILAGAALAAGCGSGSTTASTSSTPAPTPSAAASQTADLWSGAAVTTTPMSDADVAAFDKVSETAMAVKGAPPGLSATPVA